MKTIRIRPLIPLTLTCLGSKKEHYFPQRTHKPRIIWIVGDGRSGTTWLSNLLNYHNKYRYLFEPFHPDFINLARDYPYYPYLNPEKEDAFFYEIYKKIFWGSLHHIRIDQHNKNYFSQDRLVKDIFAHLYIKWIDRYFPDVLKILILRHPFAVAVSKEKLKEWSWLTEPKLLLSQPHLQNDFLKPFKDIIESAESYFEKQVVTWAAIHYVPLKQLAAGRIHLTFYENLCTNPDSEIRKLLVYCCENPKKTFLDPRLIAQFRKPSQVSRKESSINTNENLISGWQKSLTTNQIKKGIHILKAFGLEKIYNEELMPDNQAAEQMLTRR